MEKRKFINRLKGRFTRAKILKFLDKQGFYIILFLCLCIIGATAFFTSNGGVSLRRQPEGPGTITESIPTESSDVDTIDIGVIDIITGDDEETVTDGENEPFPTPAGKDEQPTFIETASPQEPFKPAREMAMPVSGEIIKGFAMDELVYSKTLKEWTTHSGIDIEGALGAEVRAALDGVVESIEADTLMGIVITIDHGEGLKTVYAGVSTKDMVRVGQKVDKGQVISGIGRTAAIEIADAPHLHFEVILNNVHQDPIEYLDR